MKLSELNTQLGQALKNLEELAEMKSEEDRRESDEKTANAINILSILAIFSALCDGFGVMDIFSEYIEGVVHRDVHALLYAAVILIVFGICFRAVRGIFPKREKRKHMRRKRDAKQR